MRTSPRRASASWRNSRPGSRRKNSSSRAIPRWSPRAHAAGLTVTSWTFRADDKEMKYPSVKEEMSHFLYDLGIDALFTNNPDQFPRR